MPRDKIACGACLARLRAIILLVLWYYMLLSRVHLSPKYVSHTHTVPAQKFIHSHNPPGKCALKSYSCAANALWCWCIYTCRNVRAKDQAPKASSRDSIYTFNESSCDSCVQLHQQLHQNSTLNARIYIVNLWFIHNKFALSMRAFIFSAYMDIVYSCRGKLNECPLCAHKVEKFVTTTRSKSCK